MTINRTPADATDGSLVSTQPRRPWSSPLRRERRDDERDAETRAVEEREDRTAKCRGARVRPCESQDRAERRTEARRPTQREEEAKRARAEDRDARQVVDPSLAIQPLRGPPTGEEHPQQHRSPIRTRSTSARWWSLQQCAEASEEGAETHEHDRESDDERDRPDHRATASRSSLERSGGAAEEREVTRQQWQHARRDERDEAGRDGDGQRGQQTKLGSVAIIERLRGCSSPSRSTHREVARSRRATARSATITVNPSRPSAVIEGGAQVRYRRDALRRGDRRPARSRRDRAVAACRRAARIARRRPTRAGRGTRISLRRDCRPPPGRTGPACVAQPVDERRDVVQHRDVADESDGARTGGHAERGGHDAVDAVDAAIRDTWVRHGAASTTRRRARASTIRSPAPRRVAILDVDHAPRHRELVQARRRPSSFANHSPTCVEASLQRRTYSPSAFGSCCGSGKPAKAFAHESIGVRDEAGAVETDRCARATRAGALEARATRADRRDARRRRA